MTTKIERMTRLLSSMDKLGFTYSETQSLRRIEMTLQRWGENECGNGNDHMSWSIERDETTDKPFMVYHPHTGKSYREPIADKEAGALKRMAKIVESRNARFDKKDAVVGYHQGDPRGCALYIVRVADLNGRPVDTCYTCGVAVCA